MSKYPRMQGKKGKKLKEKRRKEKLRRQQSGGGPNVDTSSFMGIEYEDSIFTPWLNEDGSLKAKDEAGEQYSKPSLKKYTKVGIDVTDNFYEKDEEGTENCSEEMEEEDLADTHKECFYVDTKPDSVPNSEDESEDTDSEDSDEEMPLPTFLLNKHTVDYPPMEVVPMPTAKEEHKTRKIFAKTKEKGIIRAFQFLMNNEYINSFTFIPIPISSKDIRATINRFCEKFDMNMNTKRKDDWYIITVSKPAKWSKKNVRKGAVERNDKYSSESSDDSASSGCEMEYSKPVNQTLMEGLSTPIGSDNLGNQLLKKMGWSGGGLGDGRGIEEPIQIHIKRDNKGIGATDKTVFSGKTEMSFVKSTQN